MTAELDFKELEGFQFDSRARAIGEWRERKEAQQFEKVVNRLRVKKWQRQNPEKRAVKSARYYAKSGVKERQLSNARLRRRAAPDTTVFTCKGCGTQWCRVPGTRGLAGAGDWCTDQCRQRTSARSRVGEKALTALAMLETGPVRIARGATGGCISWATATALVRRGLAERVGDFVHRRCA